MGYALLWIESLLVSLLATAAWLAWVARLRRPWRRVALGIMLPLVLLLFYAALTAGVGALDEAGLLGGGRTYPFPTPLALLVLTALFVAGSVRLLVRGLRRADGNMAAAAGWRRGKLAKWLVGTALLWGFTFWMLDLAARQQMAALRAEARALALSVAPPRPADRDNAVFVYQRAFEAMGRTGDGDYRANGTWEWDKSWWKAWNAHWSRGADESGKIDFDLHDPQLHRFLARQATALKLLRQAAAMPGYYVEYDYTRFNLAASFPDLQPMFMAARLLALDAVASAAEGNNRQAIDDINAVFLLAHHVASNNTLVNTLVAVTTDYRAVNALQAVLACGQVAGEDLAAVRIPDAGRLHAALKRALRFEEASRLDIYVRAADGECSFSEFGLVEHVEYGCFRRPWRLPAVVYRVFLLTDDVQSQRRYAGAIDRFVGRPYVNVKHDMQELDRRMHDKPGGLLTAELMSGVMSVVRSSADVEARLDAARVGLALAAYRAQKGRFPAQLDDLTTEMQTPVSSDPFGETASANVFLSSVPIDPFDGKPLKYRRSGQGASVYSIGPEANAAPDEQPSRREICFTVPEPAAPKLPH